MARRAPLPALKRVGHRRQVLLHGRPLAQVAHALVRLGHARVYALARIATEVDLRPRRGCVRACIEGHEARPRPHSRLMLCLCWRHHGRAGRGGRHGRRRWRRAGHAVAVESICARLDPVGILLHLERWVDVVVEQLCKLGEQFIPVARACALVQIAQRKALRGRCNLPRLIVVRLGPADCLEHIVGRLLPHRHVVNMRLEQVVVECSVPALLLEDERVERQQEVESRAKRLPIQVQ
mmetsp:Transcript_15753/g.46559  ORF Transcript_15753/g.46559 Transcript_15753/m.46559 type:complete len:237 (+) Transcript_15753:528-1238(+)